MQKKKILNGLSVILFVVSLVLWFVVKAIRFDGLLSQEFSFLQLAFGDKRDIGIGIIEVLGFSFFNALVPLLLVVGVGLGALRVVSKPKKKTKGNTKLLGFVIFILGVAAAVLVLLVKEVAHAPNSLPFKDYKLTTEAIIIAVMSGLAGISAVASDII